MKNLKNANATAKTSNAKTNLTKINLDKFADSLKDKELKEKSKKNTIYNYPETFSEADINAEKGKTFRNKLRNDLRRISNNIFVFAKTKDLDNLKKEVEKFKIFYKENYKINDFSLSSLSQSKNEIKAKDISLMLSIINEVK